MSEHDQDSAVDVLVAGGGYAGMAAALQVARTHRRVRVLDTGLRRNRFALAAHGVLGWDGASPAEIADTARRQLMAYPTVSWVDAAALEARKTDGGFEVRSADGRLHRAARLVLATGMVDELPAVPGLAERWGRSVMHCPYCHGYELRPLAGEGPIGVLATLPTSHHQALLVRDWGPVVFFPNGQPLAPEDEAHLRDAGVKVEPTLVEAMVGDPARLRLKDGREIGLRGLFVATQLRQASPLPRQLGCEFEAGPMGDFIRTGLFQRTSVDGVFACGDAARPAGSLSLAIGDGAMAGVGAHQSLMFPS